MDIRRRRTRLRLQAALRDLLADQPLSGISVDALARRAGVSRPTFYANYADLTEMLEEYLSGLLDQIEARHETLLHATGPEDKAERLRSLVSSIFADLDRDDPRLRALLGGALRITAESRFTALIDGLMARAPAPEAAPVAPAIRQLHAHYYTGAFLGMLRFWLSRPDGLDAEGIGHIFTDLALHGRMGACAAPGNGH